MPTKASACGATKVLSGYKSRKKNHFCETQANILSFMLKSKPTIMKKWLIGSLVGALLVFVWQFLSWTVLHFHYSESKYTPTQDSILRNLSSNLKEGGVYMMPTVPPGSSMETEQEVRKKANGNPMAMVTYVTSFDNSMTMPMIRGYLINLFLVFSFIYIISRGSMPSGMRIFAAAIALGFFSWLWGPYMSHNWMQLPLEATHGNLIDDLVAWGLVGIWLGWWLNRK